MARFALLSEDDGPPDVVAAMLERRGGELINLDRMLLHSPALAKAWNGFLGTVRTDLDVPARLRELAMCCVAVANSAEYEYFQHAPLYIAAGASEQQAEALWDLDAAAADDALYDATERAVIALTAEMTRNVAVTEDTFAAVEAVFDDPRHVVEIVGVIAAYNMVSRFLVALEVDLEEGDR